MAKRVLIVDDEPNIVISLEFLMRQSGYEIRVARDGREAETALAEFQPDLVLLDVMLPHKSGFELCQTIRENPDWKSLKIVLLTAKGREMDITKGLSLGADDYVSKPFSTKELVEKVNILINEP
ncbi:MAG: response regulator [Calditrichia bacterium]|nr:response regulator [Calditrichota bacterium]MCB0270628.1 response regulator [Calditrichota bacterium]MCB0287895.1 response regulator [Calditrichota bacterium]MCB9066754.1 response regulator [Calditrichia bacterium]